MASDSKNERPREIPINQALCRPDHLWGAERVLVLSTALLVIPLACLAIDLWITVFAILFWLIVFTSLKMMAKSDPLMSQIYTRHIKYRPYYPARSTPWATTNKSFKGWK